MNLSTFYPQIIAKADIAMSLHYISVSAPFEDKEKNTETSLSIQKGTEEDKE